MPAPGGAAEQHAPLCEEGQIRVLVFEYLIRNALWPPRNMPIFVELDRSERRELASRLPGYNIRSAGCAEYVDGVGFREKVSRKKGVLVSTRWLKISGNTASIAGALGGTGEVLYGFRLRKNAKWEIEQVSRLGTD